MESINERLMNKWGPLLDHADFSPIKQKYRKHVTAQLLENTVDNLQTEGKMLTEAGIPVNAMGASSSTASDGAIDTFDPVLISLVRRSMPNLIAYDMCGVQPMTGPVGLVFAMRSRYANQTHTETFYNEVNTQHSSVTSGANTLGQKHVGTLPGNSTVSSNLAEEGLYNFGGGMSRAQAEALGTDSNVAFPEMSFSIEKFSIEAKSRALKAEYTLELAQDLKAIHGLEAENELSNILQSEILAEINREIIRTIVVTAKQGATENTTTSGFFDLDLDSNGRWMVEKFKGMMFQVDREANKVAKETRRGRANFILCSSDVASALQAAGNLDYTPALDQNNNMNIDDTGNTFAGILNGKYRVYIDPYSDGGQYMVAGYKGASAWDAGLYYCPYVPLQLVRAVDPSSFIPKIGFKTRYGIAANPFAEGTTAGAGVLKKDSNVYFRRIIIKNLM